MAWSYTTEDIFQKALRLESGLSIEFSRYSIIYIYMYFNVPRYYNTCIYAYVVIN